LSGKGVWIKYGIASALIHAAVLSVYVPLNAPLHRSDPVDVIVLNETSPPSPLCRVSEMAHKSGRSPQGGPGPRVKEQVAFLPKEPVGGPLEHQAEPLPPAPVRPPPEDVVASTRTFAPSGPEDGVAIGGSGISGPGTPGGGGPGGTSNGTGTGGGSGQGEGADIGGRGFGAPGGPKFLHREVPAYPMLARRRGKEGTVVLMVTIDAVGKLSKVDVVQASDRVFVEPSVQAVRKSTFLPATRDGQPVASAAIYPVRFSLREERSEP